ncbi:MAG: L-glutamate gamma-semialdehyde dehydrogenase, partial [Nitrospiraceae bacterium]
MAYLVRRLLENTSNESFLRKEYSESEPLDRLLAPPHISFTARAEDNPPAPPDRFMNEPHTDFSKASARAAMTEAIGQVKSQLGRALSYPIFFGKTPSGGELVSYNPSEPNEIVGRLRNCGPEDVPHAVHMAQLKRAEWASRTPHERADFLAKAAAIMRRRRFELAAWEIFETGKPWREADADVAEAIDFCEFYAREMRRLGRPRRLGHEPGEVNHLVFSPRGIAAVIAPWNFPLAIPSGMVSAALVSGNVVLFKPSERSSVMGLLLIEVLQEAGIPDGVIQILPGGPEVGQALVAHPDVHLIAFTGSKDVGLRIMAQAAHVQPGQQMVKRVIAEMGGKNAIVIDETADLDEAVTGVVASFTGYQGQKCSACSRAIV